LARQKAGLGNASKSTSSDKASAASDAEVATEAEAKHDATFNMKQEWKGGTSHGTLDEWLESLEPDHNSNWKVVNRRMSSCVGVWEWAVNPGVRNAICTQYLTEYLTAMNIFNFTTGTFTPTAASTVYPCSCVAADLDYTGDTGGNNQFYCTGYTKTNLYCYASDVYCSNPNIVYTTDPEGIGGLTYPDSNALCTTDQGQTWPTPASTTTTTVVDAAAEAKATISEICSGAADVSSTTEAIAHIVAKTVNERARAEISACDAQVGYHWSGSGIEGSCVENTCVCGTETGAVGPGCPVEGATVCLPSQQAKCSEVACAKTGYWYNGTANTCLTNVCSPEGEDLARCCAPTTQGNDFLVVVQTLASGSCNLQTTVYGPENDQYITAAQGKTDFPKDGSTTLSVSNSNMDGFTPDRICLTLDKCTVTINNDGEPSGITLYNGGISTDATVENEVGCTFGSWVEFRSNTRTQCSSVSPCSR
jgi:hypothetical protein